MYLPEVMTHKNISLGTSSTHQGLSFAMTPTKGIEANKTKSIFFYCFLDLLLDVTTFLDAKK